jgi:hypothetical protein
MRRLAITLITAGVLALASFAAPAIAAAGDSPCQGFIGVSGSIGMPAGSWAPGRHTYAVTFYWPPTEPGDPGTYTFDTVTFTVSESAPLVAGPVFLRLAGLSTSLGSPTPYGDTINPAQETVFWAGVFLMPGDYATMKEARSYLADNTVAFAWDGGTQVAGSMRPISDFCAQGGFAIGDTVHMTGQLYRHYAG